MYVGLHMIGIVAQKQGILMYIPEELKDNVRIWHHEFGREQQLARICYN